MIGRSEETKNHKKNVAIWVQFFFEFCALKEKQIGIDFFFENLVPETNR